MDEDNIQDVDFEEVGGDKSIRGKVLYYSTSQVAAILGTTDSKIRYYTTQFDDILHIEISNKQRRYKDEDISKLKFICELKEEGLTLKQISEYCGEVDFNNETGIKIKETNPLSIKTLAKALIEENSRQMNEFKKDVMEFIALKLEEQAENIKHNNDIVKDQILEQVSLTVDDIMNDKLTSNLEEQERLITEHESQIIEKLHKSLEERRVLQQENKSNIFSKLFGKK